MSQDFLSCSYTAICSGCDWLLHSASTQRDLKTAHLRKVWSDTGLIEALPSVIAFRTAGVGATRDRIDLTLTNEGYDGSADTGTQRLGLFDRFRTGLVDLQGCPQLSPSLESFLQEFRKFQFPIRRGSVRLRVAPDGTRGAWLDFANLDTKALLDQQTTLQALLDSGVVVEIGQRRKRLVRRGEFLKLDDPVLYPWFETYLGDAKGVDTAGAGASADATCAVPLYATIGSFTQPGFKVNRLLIREVIALAGSGARGAEFGAGIGNFTIPLAHLFDEVKVYEVDRLALEGLSRTLSEQGLTSKVQIEAGNYQGEKARSVDFAGVDLLLVDPPRSGLMTFVEALKASPHKPASLLYISCFAESFAQDSAHLLQMGYRLEQISIVDQFPQSRHYETVALFKLVG